MIAAFFAFGVTEIGGPSSLFETIGTQAGGLFLATGFLNALLYVLYRLADYWHELA